MNKMNRKQELFCEYYIVHLNATKAAIQAGYSERSARKIASENLMKPDIRMYIDEKMSKKVNEIIAAQDEILTFLTKVMRGEVYETRSLVIGIGDGISKIETTEVQVTPRDRVKAAELLGRRYGLWDCKEDEDSQLDINIICDIPRPKDLLES
jgi:phage terminase small subunit